MDEMGHLAKGETDRARGGVTSWSVCEFFTFYTILLGGEGERDEGAC